MANNGWNNSFLFGKITDSAYSARSITLKERAMSNGAFLLKTCRRCAKQYVKSHKCEVIETEQERVKREGRH
jgi:hypothetical protein